MEIFSTASISIFSSSRTANSLTLSKVQRLARLRILSHVSSGASYTEYLLSVVSKWLNSDVANLRVIKHPEEPCEIFTLDVLQSIGVMVGRTTLLAVVVVRAADLLAEKQRFTLKKIAVYSVEVVFDLRTHVNAQ